MSLLLLAADLVAIVLLVFGLFVPRHHRRDLVVAFLVVNVGVLALMATLSATAVGVGLGLGLFGVLSIIRLRSEELRQHEVAYYFAALALGLLGGSSGLSVYLVAGLMALVLLALFIGDHPRIARGSTRQQLVLDRAYTDEELLLARVESLVSGSIQSLTVVRTDLVNDTTTVDVRYGRTSRGRAVPAPAEPSVEPVLAEAVSR
jgi:MFS family permease